MENKLPKHVQDVIDEHFANELLLDVFKVWNCDLQSWVENSPTIFRFESNDLIVAQDGAGYIQSIRPIDTSIFRNEIALEGNARFTLVEDTGDCLSWVREKSSLLDC